MCVSDLPNGVSIQASEDLTIHVKKIKCKWLSFEGVVSVVVVVVVVPFLLPYNQVSYCYT